jgi:DNA-directed RNA polymerase subunit K/omega
VTPPPPQQPPAQQPPAQPPPAQPPPAQPPPAQPPPAAVTRSAAAAAARQGRHKAKPLSLADIAPSSYNRLSKFEEAVVVGERAMQLAWGAQSTMPPSPELAGMEPLDLARWELSEGRIPLEVNRHWPDGSTKKYRLEADGNLGAASTEPPRS